MVFELAGESDSTLPRVSNGLRLEKDCADPKTDSRGVPLPPCGSRSVPRLTADPSRGPRRRSLGDAFDEMTFVGFISPVEGFHTGVDDWGLKHEFVGTRTDDGNNCLG